MSVCDPGALPLRANSIDLPAVTEPPTFKTVLSVDGEADRWRVIDAFSAQGRPFALRIEPTVAGASGAPLNCVATGGARVSLPASGLVIKVANLSGEGSTISVTVADGLLPTQNQQEVSGAFAVAGSEVHDIPPYATHVRLDTAAIGAKPASALELLDGSGGLTAQADVDAQPAGGLPVGANAQVKVTSAGTLFYRLVFLLSF